MGTEDITVSLQLSGWDTEVKAGEIERFCHKRVVFPSKNLILSGFSMNSS